MRGINMMLVKKLDKGDYYLVVERGNFKKMAKYKSLDRKYFFVKFKSYLRNGTDYVYPSVQIGNSPIRVPKELIGKKISFKVEVLEYGKRKD